MTTFDDILAPLLDDAHNYPAVKTALQACIDEQVREARKQEAVMWSRDGHRNQWAIARLTQLTKGEKT